MLRERFIKFYEVLNGDNIHLQSTKSAVVNIGQTTALSFLSLMVPSMTDIIPFSWVLSHVSPILITTVNTQAKKNIERCDCLHHLRGAHTLVYITLPLPLLIPLQVLLGKTLRRHKIYCFIITRDAVSLTNLLSKELCLLLISFHHKESVVIRELFLVWRFQALCS